MINLIKNRSLMTLLAVLSVTLLTYGHVSAGIVGLRSNTFTRTASSASAVNGESILTYTAVHNFAQQTAAAAIQEYLDSLSKYIVPSTALTGYEGYAVNCWVTTTSGDSALVAGDSVQFVLEVSPDGSKWVQPIGAHPTTYNGTASSGTGTNVVTFGPFNRKINPGVDSTAQLFDNYGLGMASAANFVRVRALVRGIFDGTPDSCVYNYKAVLNRLK